MDVFNSQDKSGVGAHENVKLNAYVVHWQFLRLAIKISSQTLYFASYGTCGNKGL